MSMVKGVVRSIDDLGRIVIPKEIRKSLNIEAGDPMDIFHDGGTICLKKVAERCVCCGTEEAESVKLRENKGVLLCQNCLIDFAKQEEMSNEI